jgi:fatty acid synthase subunit alpha, fungi type
MSVNVVAPITQEPVLVPTAPKMEVTTKGDIVYSEVVHENVHKLEAYYVEEMASGNTISGSVDIQNSNFGP